MDDLDLDTQKIDAKKLHNLFEKQRLYLNDFFNHLEFEQLAVLVQKLQNCSGSLFLTGVGKSGYIAEKIVKTLASIGIRAFFLSPTGALHGDIGCLFEGDVLLMLSKSGESSELLDLIRPVRNKKVLILSVTSNPNSRLAKESDFSYHLPVYQELCSFNLVPTTSSTAQLIFGDCLAIALMEAKSFTPNHFAMNHPAGLLGRKLTFRVEDLMLKGKNLPLCLASDLLVNVLHELSQKKCGCLLVINPEHQLEGIFTDGDLRRVIQKEGKTALDCPMRECMTKNPLTIKAHELALKALEEMEKDASRLITVLPVVQEQQVVGLIRMHDILQVGLSSK